MRTGAAWVDGRTDGRARGQTGKPTALGRRSPTVVARSPSQRAKDFGSYMTKDTEVTESLRLLANIRVTDRTKVSSTTTVLPPSEYLYKAELQHKFTLVINT